MPKKTKRKKLAIQQHKSKSGTTPSDHDSSQMVFEDATSRRIEIPSVFKQHSSVFGSKKSVPASNIGHFKKDIHKSINITLLILCIEYALFAGQQTYHDILSKLLSIKIL